MNGLTKEIAEWLKVDLDTALRVQNHMPFFCDTRFSQDSTRKLKSDAKLAYANLLETAK